MNVEKAQELKKTGNDFFGKREYKQALEAYAEALEYLDDNDAENRAAIFSNRGACFVMMVCFAVLLARAAPYIAAWECSCQYLVIFLERFQKCGH